MTAVICLQREFVYEDIETPSSSPYLNIVDLDIPDGTLVVGSGALVTHVLVGGVWTVVDLVSGVEGEVNALRISDGPHPSDSTLWRVMLSQTDNKRLRIRAWITAIG